MLFTELIGHPFPLFQPLIPFSNPELVSKFFNNELLDLVSSLFIEFDLTPTSKTEISSNHVFPVAPAVYFNKAILTEVFSGPVLNVAVTSPY